MGWSQKDVPLHLGPVVGCDWPFQSKQVVPDSMVDQDQVLHFDRTIFSTAYLVPVKNSFRKKRKRKIFFL